MKKILRPFFTKTSGLCYLSAFLLILSFPKTELGFLAWFAFVPLLLALDHRGARASALFSYLAGCVFFSAMLYWFIFVTVPGMILLILYFALYFALFGLGYFWFSRQGLWKRIFLIPAWWVVTEFLRSHLLSGFGWVLLGHSQYKNLSLIQIVDIVGVYGISFLVMMVNVFLKEMVVGLSSKADRAGFIKQIAKPFVMIVLILILSLGYGFYRLRQPMSANGASIKISVLQGNIANERRWHYLGWPRILDEYLELAARAAKDKPDLIVWPETAFPGYSWEDGELFTILQRSIGRLRIPSLVGLVTREQEEYFNTALLFDLDGEIHDRYDKIHLVPFGEYLPLRTALPFLSAIVPIDDFTSGKTFSMFSISDKDQPKDYFSVLICFEDTVPHLVRKFVQRGSNLLINITNDDWFQDTKAPFLHLQAALFRAVENRRPLIRAANTGVSGFVDSRGRIISLLSDAKGKNTYVQGLLTHEMYGSDEKTFYTKYGDVFTYFCFGFILIEIMMCFYRRSQESHIGS